jgi:outer membrane protein assembly factor BamE (lipoprotein component of BamABCDE complex)
MSIQTSCPSCRRSYTLPDEHAGATVRCKGCDEKFVVKASSSRNDDQDRPRKQSPTARTEGDRDAGRPRGADRAAPRADGRAASKNKGVPLWVWLAAAGVGLAVVAAGVAIVILMGGKAAPASKITKENQEKIQLGMTEDDVRAILGDPTMTEDPRAPFQDVGSPRRLEDIANTKTLVWQDGSNKIRVEFLNSRAVQVTGDFPTVGEQQPDSSAGLTEENFRRLKQNMTEREVNNILGKPRSTTVNTATWEDGPNSVVATFNGGLFNATGKFGGKTMHVVEPTKDGSRDEKKERLPRKPADPNNPREDDLTEENFNKLKANMTEAAVRRILGPQTRSRRTATAVTLTWEQGQNTVTVSFVAGKLNRADAQIDGKMLTITTGVGPGP